MCAGRPSWGASRRAMLFPPGGFAKSVRGFADTNDVGVSFVHAQPLTLSRSLVLCCHPGTEQLAARSRTLGGRLALVLFYVLYT